MRAPTVGEKIRTLLEIPMSMLYTHCVRKKMREREMEQLSQGRKSRLNPIYIKMILWKKADEAEHNDTDFRYTKSARE